MNANQRKAIHEVLVHAGEMAELLGATIEMIEDPIKSAPSWEQIAKFDNSIMNDVMQVIRRLKTISDEIINND